MGFQLPPPLLLQGRALRPLGVPEAFFGGGDVGPRCGRAVAVVPPSRRRGALCGAAHRERRRKMAQAVNVAELPLPQLEVLKNQLDQVGGPWGAPGRAWGAEWGVTGAWGHARLGRVTGRRL